MPSAVKKIPIYVILVILTVIWLLPVVTTFLVSFKSSKDFVSQTFYQLPTQFYFFKNLVTVIQEYRLGAHFFNSLIYAFLGTLVRHHRLFHGGIQHREAPAEVQLRPLPRHL